MENGLFGGGLKRKSNAIIQARDVGSLGWDTVEEMWCSIQIQEVFWK